MYKNNKTKLKQKDLLNFLCVPSAYLPLTKSANMVLYRGQFILQQRQSVPVEEPKVFSTGTKNYLYRNQVFLGNNQNTLLDYTIFQAVYTNFLYR